jgi:uncharacterized membrane protein (UPF0127 family)
MSAGDDTRAVQRTARSAQSFRGRSVRSWRRRRAISPAETPPRLAGLPHLVLGTGEVIHIANTFRTRLRGLLGTDAMPAHHGLLLTSTRSVHTLGMRMPLDLVWVDRAGNLVGLDEGVAPGAKRRRRDAWGVVEVPAGSGPRFAALAREGAVAMMDTH